MVSIKYIFFITIFLCNKGTLYTSELRKYCTHQYISSTGLLPARYCCKFNEAHKDTVDITSIALFKRVQLDPGEFDGTDRFLHNAVSYSYHHILAARYYNAYLMSDEYYILKKCTEKKLQEKTTLAAEQYNTGILSHEQYIAIFDRINEYEGFLHEVSTYYHDCMGLITPMSTVYCMRALLQND